MHGDRTKKAGMLDIEKIIVIFLQHYGRKASSQSFFSDLIRKKSLFLLSAFVQALQCVVAQPFNHSSLL